MHDLRFYYTLQHKCNVRRASKREIFFREGEEEEEINEAR